MTGIDGYIRAVYKGQRRTTQRLGTVAMIHGLNSDTPLPTDMNTDSSGDR